MGCLVALLIVILATLAAGPIGFILALVLLLAVAIITGSLHLLWNVILLPFRLLEHLTRSD